MKTLVVLVLIALVISVSCRKGPKIERIHEMMCSSNPEDVAKAERLISKMPKKVHEAWDECEKENNVSELSEDELKTQLCDDSTGLHEKMKACMEMKKPKH